MIIFVVVFSFKFVKKYFQVQLYSTFNLDDNVFTWCTIMQQCEITIHPCHVVNVYWIDTVCVQNNLPTEFSKRTVFII